MNILSQVREDMNACCLKHLNWQFFSLTVNDSTQLECFWSFILGKLYSENCLQKLLKYFSIFPEHSGIWMPGEGWRMSINVGSGKITLFPSSSANVEDDIYKGAICFQCWCFIFSDLLTKISQLFVSDIFTKIESSGDYIHPLIYRIMTKFYFYV